MSDKFIRIVCRGGVEFVVAEMGANQSGYLKRKIMEGK